MCNHLSKVIGHPLPFVSPHVARFSAGETIVILAQLFVSHALLTHANPN